MHHEDDYDDNNDDPAKPVCEPVQKFRAVVFLHTLDFCLGLAISTVARLLSKSVMRKKLSVELLEEHIMRCVRIC
jgi:hypothetical protein